MLLKKYYYFIGLSIASNSSSVRGVVALGSAIARSYSLSIASIRTYCLYVMLIFSELSFGQ
jgi:hypothetical protein